VPAFSNHQSVSIKIFNSTGQEIAVLLNRELPGGSYMVRWDGTTRSGFTAASGVYFYTVSIGMKQQTGKMLLVK
jgi:flagellar hook assembly protein FlgD